MITDSRDKKSQSPKSPGKQKDSGTGKKSDNPKIPTKVGSDKKHSVGDDNEKMKETEVTADPENANKDTASESIVNAEERITNKHHGEQKVNDELNN